MRMRRPSPTTVIAIVALVVALGGTAIAASRYIITSASQIKPSAIKELEARASAAEVKLVSAGAHAVVARVRSSAPVVTAGEPESINVPLTGFSWIQRPEEIDQLLGQVTYTYPSTCSGQGQSLVLEIFLDKQLLEVAQVGPRLTNEPEDETETHWIVWEANGGLPMYLYEPRVKTTHQLEMKAHDACASGGGTGHVTIDSISVDVAAIR
jgi:hypothetical protein